MTVLVSEENITAEMVRPLDGRVLIRRAVRPEKTVGGIVLPETTRGISQTGVVVKIADDVECVTVGTQVIFSQYAALPMIATDDTDLVLVRDKDLLCIVEK